MTAKHIYNIVLGIRGKQKSHELIQTGKRMRKIRKQKITILNPCLLRFVEH
jgi:hypothetical protein